MSTRTHIEISGGDFLINGALTFPGRIYGGSRIEGLLPNARMIQGIFDDLNPETRARWNYPDGAWDAERNTEAMLSAMPEWRAHGLLAFTVGLQGGSPEGYSGQQPWHNSAFSSQGALRPEYFERLGRILGEADRLGMVVIVSLFYFGQDQRLDDEAAVRRAILETVRWLADRGSANVLIEVANECDHRTYSHECLRPERIPALIRLAQEASSGRVANRLGRYAVGTSLCGGRIPPSSIVEASDLIFLHGNGVETPEAIAGMVETVRAMPEFRGQPVVFNEDDHFAFDCAENHFLAATRAHASWGYFDYRIKGETDFHEGYQSMPCDWGIRSERKRAFFRLLAEMTGES